MRYLTSKFSVTLKTGLGVVQGHWKWYCSIDHVRLSIGLPLVYLVLFLSYLIWKNIVTMKSELEVTQGHTNWVRSYNDIILFRKSIYHAVDVFSWRYNVVKNNSRWLAWIFEICILCHVTSIAMLFCFTMKISMKQDSRLLSYDQKIFAVWRTSAILNLNIFILVTRVSSGRQVLNFTKFVWFFAKMFWRFLKWWPSAIFS